MSRIIKEKDRKLELLQFQLEEGQKMHDQDNQKQLQALRDQLATVFQEHQTEVDGLQVDLSQAQIELSQAKEMLVASQEEARASKDMLEQHSVSYKSILQEKTNINLQLDQQLQANSVELLQLKRVISEMQVAKSALV